jgi:cytochrome c oxidase subunit 2
MPRPVGRKLSLLALAAAAALAIAGVAAAGNGGTAPPSPHSPNAGRINDAYYLILAVAALVFLVVEGSLITFVVRYRRRGRPRDTEGPQIRGNTRLELIWTAIPVVLLAVITTFVFYKLPGIRNVPPASAADRNLNVNIVAHQFYWQFTYPNGAVAIDTLRVPAGRVVTLDITSRDVDHSWWIPELEGKFDAIPGETNHTWFRADKVGTYIGQCGEFCGIFHAIMNARVIAMPPAEFQGWLTTRAAADLGRDEWVGACSKCHGPQGKGNYGPALNKSPLLTQRKGLYTIATQGQGRMPPVARGWTKTQLDALFGYVSKRIYKGAAPAGSAGG